ncbi:hypothetical protein GJ744_009255 [Endocarpon pusillum]|uniref:DUF6594 domain-containing protein n=1 Tax=Endocarpon pusillum TaxID=364733 RepID=A0A8H7AK27_9EURO|nr:hypothetical protein GJ744_009255 [Endocarpon pusillum]
MATEQKRGYQQLADFIAWDRNLAIFPRFCSANMLCLLHMQAEICELEERLEDLGHVNNNNTFSDEKRRRLCYDWSVLKELGSESPEKKLLAELRIKLAQYNQALTDQITLAAQKPPERSDMSYLQYWLQHPQGGASALRGPGSMTWSDLEDCGRRSLDDFVSLSPSRDVERTLTQWMLDALWPILRHLPRGVMPEREFGPHDESGKSAFTSMGDSRLFGSIADQISSFVATTLILIPVITLHFVQSADARLIIIVVFSLAFQGLVVLATEAKRSEVFAATAAFVAIQVVYVGSALGSGQ